MLAVAPNEPDPAAAIRTHAPGGGDRIIEVAFSDNIDSIPPQPRTRILYDKGTQFHVLRNALDPATGKTVIQMKEVG